MSDLDKIVFKQDMLDELLTEVSDLLIELRALLKRESDVVCICDGVPLQDGSYLINKDCRLHGFSGSHK
jgi:hypothetical protein